MTWPRKKIFALTSIVALMFISLAIQAANKQALPQPIIALPSQDLNSFVQHTLANNPAVQAAEATVAAAAARQRGSANPLYNPELGAEAQSAIDNTYAVQVSQTIDWSNKRGARAKVGLMDLAVAETELASVRQQLTAELLDALARYQAAQQIVILSQKRTSLMQQFVALSKKQFKSGDVARVDVDLAQLALSEALAQQADAEVTLNQALESVTAITGAKAVEKPSFSPSLPKLNINAIDVDHFLYQLPAIKTLNNQYLSAAARIQLAERQRYPDPTIGLQGGHQQGAEGNEPLVGVVLSIPLFIRNNYQPEVDAANYDALQADQKRMELVRQMRAEIINSAKRYQTLYQANQQWQAVSGKPLTDGMTLISRLWQAGEITATDYLVQIKQRVDSQIAGAALKGQAWQAWVAWLNASGQINTWLAHQ